MPKKRNRNNRGRVLSRSHSHVGEDTAKIFGIRDSRILKRKSSLMIFEKHANLKYKYGNRHFWCRGYYVDTVGKNTAAIKEYIQNQLKEDLEYDQMSLVFRPLIKIVLCCSSGLKSSDVVAIACIPGFSS